MSRQRTRAVLLAIAFACGAPTCQDLNPEFVEEAGEGGTADSADTNPVDDGLGTTAGVDDGVEGSGSPSTSDGVDTSATTSAADTTTAEDGETTTGEPQTSTSEGGSSSSDGGTCMNGELLCPGAICIDPMTDDDNCGECGNKCNPAQEHCELGVCVDN